MDVDFTMPLVSSQCSMFLVLFPAETIYVRIANVQVIMLENALMWQFATIADCQGK